MKQTKQTAHSPAALSPTPGTRQHRYWSAAPLLLFALGCGDSSTTQPGAVGCPAGQQDCGAACADLSADPANCGACGTACGSGQTCQAGVCTCQTGLVACGDLCVNTLSDGNHCGTCGNVCSAGQVCSKGACSDSCAPGEMACGTSCVNLETSVLHCGACNTPCPAGQVCTSGQCGCSNPAQTLCGGTCTDTLTDPSHCGLCGAACAVGQSCVNGACTGGSASGTGGTGGTDTTATGGTTGGTAQDGTGGAATGGDTGSEGTGGAPPVSCSTPLADRVTVTPISVSSEISAGSGRQQWGATGLPVMLATSSDGRAKAAWSDGSNVYIMPLDAANQRAGDDIVVEGSEVRGLVAHDDGAAVLVVRDDQMVFVRLDEAGNTTASLSIVGGNSHTTDGDRWIDSWPHQGRLAWSGSEYAAYFGQTGNHGAAGDHQGDHYTIISPDGAELDGGWDWGCSHSLDVRLAHNGSIFAPVCTSDTYPGAGIWLRNRIELSPEPSITNTGGGTKLGGLVPAPDGFWLTFTSPEPGPTYDVVFLHFDNEGNVSGRVMLTETDSVDEEFSHLAAYGEGDLLAGWSTDGQLSLATLDTAGSILEGPVVVSAQIGGLDDFVTYPNGDVGWAAAWDDMSTLQIVRVAACE